MDSQKMLASRKKIFKVFLILFYKNDYLESSLQE